jgi:hypothetical protein
MDGLPTGITRQSPRECYAQCAKTCAASCAVQAARDATLHHHGTRQGSLLAESDEADEGDEAADEAADEDDALLLPAAATEGVVQEGVVQVVEQKRSPRVAALEKQAVDELASLLSTLRKQQRAK